MHEYDSYMHINQYMNIACIIRIEKKDSSFRQPGTPPNVIPAEAGIRGLCSCVYYMILVTYILMTNQ